MFWIFEILDSLKNSNWKTVASMAFLLTAYGIAKHEGPFVTVNVDRPDGKTIEKIKEDILCGDLETTCKLLKKLSDSGLDVYVNGDKSKFTKDDKGEE